MIRRYRNKPVEVDGVRYDSQAEARRGGELELLQRAGQIHNLERQPKFPLVVNGKLVCTYSSDFSYEVGGVRVIEDVKSPATARDPVYRIKIKLLEALTGIRVKEHGNPKKPRQTRARRAA